VVSGGAVLAALEPVTPAQDLNSMNSEWASSDIDIYFVGMTASEAEAKVRDDWSIHFPKEFGLK
jgi:hypothetical protein